MAEKPMSDRQKMLRQVQIFEFALVELNLFLDTHPDDQKALAYLKKVQQMHEAAAKEFTQKFGPLTAASGNYDTFFTWVDDPWPWEYQADGMTCSEVIS